VEHPVRDLDRVKSVFDAAKSLAKNKVANFIWCNKSIDCDTWRFMYHNFDSLLFGKPLDQVMEYRNDLDFILLSNHLAIQDQKLYEVILEKMKRYGVDAVAHPYFFDKDIEEAVEVAINRNIAFKINTKRYVPEPKVIEYADRKGVNFTIVSDAHDIKRIGDVEWGYNMLRKLGIAEDSIITEF